jgi:uncharacterized protein YdhG (YjbR/CyaY superfamily)
MEKNPQVDEYFRRLEPDRSEALQKLREMIVGTVPDVEETFQYNMPTYVLNGEIVCAISSRSNYISAYMDVEAVERHRSELGKACGKSCVRFNHLTDPLLATLRTILVETVEAQGKQPTGAM